MKAVDQLTRHLMFAPRVRRAEAALTVGARPREGTLTPLTRSLEGRYPSEYDIQHDQLRPGLPLHHAGAREVRGGNGDACRHPPAFPPTACPCTRRFAA